MQRICAKRKTDERPSHLQSVCHRRPGLPQPTRWHRTNLGAVSFHDVVVGNRSGVLWLCMRELVTIELSQRQVDHSPMLTRDVAELLSSIMPNGANRCVEG